MSLFMYVALKYAIIFIFHVSLTRNMWCFQFSVPFKLLLLGQQRKIPKQTLHTNILRYFYPRTESKTMANFVDYKHLPACTLYIHMKLSIVARLHVLHAHGCVSEQLHSVLSSASLSSALLSLPSTCWRL